MHGAVIPTKQTKHIFVLTCSYFFAFGLNKEHIYTFIPFRVQSRTEMTLLPFAVQLEMPPEVAGNPNSFPSLYV